MPFDTVVGRIRIAITPKGTIQQIDTKDSGTQIFIPPPKKPLGRRI